MGKMGQHDRGVFAGNGLFFSMLSNFPNPFLGIFSHSSSKYLQWPWAGQKERSQSWWLVTVSAHSNARGARDMLSSDND